MKLSIIFSQLLTICFHLGSWTRTAFDRNAVPIFNGRKDFHLWIFTFLFEPCKMLISTRWQRCPQLNEMLHKELPHVCLKPVLWQLHLIAFSLYITMWRTDPFSESLCRDFKSHFSSLTNFSLFNWIFFCSNISRTLIILPALFYFYWITLRWWSKAACSVPDADGPFIQLVT